MKEGGACEEADTERGRSPLLLTLIGRSICGCTEWSVEAEERALAFLPERAGVSTLTERFLANFDDFMIISYTPFKYKESS